HNNVLHRLFPLLQAYVEQNQLGGIRIEAGFRLSKQTWLQPDVSFLRNAQLDTADENYFEGAPAIAVEVASESNTAAQLDRKMELYFAHGSEEVWVIYPRTKRIRIHFPDGRSLIAGDPLETALFPGWSAPLSAIFGN
ncbi:MAG TPA: Uma2 family endonuclease, partial [Bryobacteraceae bacterium]|nr:Uma2 family endonuclease [Bryobacteraceae bacterium]